VDLWDLVSAFGRLMRETLALEPKHIVVDETPLYVYQEMIVKRLEREERLALSGLFTPPYQRGRLVGLFLALLELIKTKWLAAAQPEPFGDIYLFPLPDPTAA
jgi:segregation and condensation protein A